MLPPPACICKQPANSRMQRLWLQAVVRGGAWHPSKIKNSVLPAWSQAGTCDAVDHLGAALDCNPEWMKTEGADRLIKQYREPAQDPDAGVRDEAQKIPAKPRPREEWASDSGADS